MPMQLLNIRLAEIERRKIMEKYITPEMDIIRFDSEDVITTSTPELEPQ